MPTTYKLLEGFSRFKKTYFGDDKALYDSMKTGQPTKILMIACCDSRVDPAILTDCDPGDIFTVRNVANLVPPCETDNNHHGTSSALEFAVNALKVESIVVMGHGNCGGIRALWQSEGVEDSKFIHRWVSIAQNAKDWVKVNHKQEHESVQLKLCEQRAVLVSLQNLMTFECIKERVEAGTLRLHGWYFDLDKGELMCYNPTTDEFEKPV
ncbi:MAG: carbonic anhydrase [Pseudomonadota bacterium]|jgi:carbonic anhydrase|uniref:Carbonic anhydrase n=2 Tax=Methylophaga TaxID=40222 RepID=F5T1E0_9GAMM|nr:MULTISPECIES: carbonic anhydrase [Methylophaga]MEC9413902.1 carbonic anhydrase [Pseudomonadota bacterium]EGL53026.1 carbonic anhydrase [Methylophaga aminisulfidivorans MP]WVI84506.1 carbonic anhydrase [Methylophaga thalassica]GLP99579.1 carbonic anhydrase [Methylophaga thalassica]HIC45138.1 carbonic anhydrase [Methylophaga sp.]